MERPHPPGFLGYVSILLTGNRADARKAQHEYMQQVRVWRDFKKMTAEQRVALLQMREAYTTKGESSNDGYTHAENT